MRKKNGSLKPRKSSWAVQKTMLEHLVEGVLGGSAAQPFVGMGGRDVSREVLRYDTSHIKTVVLGGGTGLSTVVGGNSHLRDWPEHMSSGLKEEFPLLEVIICTTDDGGSTGDLVRRFPLIGIGDIRKSCLSLVRAPVLQAQYGLDEQGVLDAARFIQQAMTYRFDRAKPAASILDHPARAVDERIRRKCPADIQAAFNGLAQGLECFRNSPLHGHCLGNLLLSGAILAEKSPRARYPGLREMSAGVDRVTRVIGSATGRIHEATCTPGQLRFLYANGVEVLGQSKSAHTRRGFPVRRVTADFVAPPLVSRRVEQALRTADLIIFAPGSLYTSIIPILQIHPIIEAIRANTHALKILGANFWVQEGETDISLRQEGRGFLVSELIEAYERNVPGGFRGLFDVVLSANLEQIPASILRNYALEGKRPIHLDRARVQEMGLHPVEAGLFPTEAWRRTSMIHHEPTRFALAIRTLLYGLLANGAYRKRPVRVVPETPPPRPIAPGRRLMHERQQSVELSLASKTFSHPGLRQVLADLIWENRDVTEAHLAYFQGVRVLSVAAWQRSTQWDNVLGFYYPPDQFIYLREDVLPDPARLRDNLLISIGESLLGNYVQDKQWLDNTCAQGSRCYQIRLRPATERFGFLSEAQLRSFLALARMRRDPEDSLVFRIGVNAQDGFLPSGLLFGLLFAWYLDNQYGRAMEYEMSLLRWPPRMLMPFQVKERRNRQALVAFFREEVFRHVD